MPPLFGGSFDDWSNPEQESSFWIEDSPYDTWLSASDTLDLAGSLNFEGHALLGTQQQLPLSNDCLSEQTAQTRDPALHGFAGFIPPSTIEEEQDTMLTSASKCSQCREAQYVNRQGLCMVCQYYTDWNRQNDVWKPSPGIATTYKSRNSSSSSLGSLNSIESVMSTTSANSKRGKRIPGGYPCKEAQCGMTFDVPSDLRHHQRKHTAKKDRPYACGCGERFSYPKDLRRHAQSVHPESVSVINQVEPGVPGALLYSIPQAAPEQDSTQASTDLPNRSESLKGKKRRADSPSRNSDSSSKSLVQRSKLWMKLIDELLFSKKGYRDRETSTAIEKISVQLDQFDMRE